MERIVRIPISDIILMVKEENDIDVANASPQIIGDFLVFQICEGKDDMENNSRKFIMTTKTRKSKKKRNRMKTRGWKIIGKIATDFGYNSNVYEPFVEALRDKDLTREDQMIIVEKILRSNRNNPSFDSINYYLDNTLKFLKRDKNKNEV